MKPEQFIRDFGVEKAREVVASASENHNKFDIDLNKTVEAYKVRPKLVDLHYLKRLVESLDLVELLGGIDGLNVLLDMANSPFALSGITRDGVFYSSEKIKELAQVHESIYGGGDE
ncbi:hypothetical protein [Acinetobacter pittii]|uniref:hypothetical protein n=1 Tax=Acinetobacter pittii TaxID=48296 RepID=UPI00226D0E40|nr:hypothetical protein [Acinetobacter pittii]MDR9713583.1 hypothetical protein [Acinetobacter pittii]